MADPHSRRAIQSRRNKKRKKRALVFGCIAAALLLGVVILWSTLQNHIVYTADGMKFDFAAADDIAVVPDTNAPEVPTDSSGFQPAAPADVSVDSNGLPPFGAGYIDALFVDIESFTVGQEAEVAETLLQKEVRSIVIDIKSDDGQLNYDSQTEYSKSAKLDTRTGKLETFIAECAARGIRVTGRISCFRDDTLPRNIRVTGIFTQENKLFEDASGMTWLDPYEADVRAYLVAVCAEAKALGVREILLDHFSFLGENPQDEIKFSAESDRILLLNELLASIRDKIGDEMILSAVIYPDVLGEGASEQKGQDLDTLISVCDRIWMHAADATGIDGLLSQARSHGEQLGDLLAVIIGERYKSAALYTE